MRLRAGWREAEGALSSALKSIWYTRGGLGGGGGQDSVILTGSKPWRGLAYMALRVLNRIGGGGRGSTGSLESMENLCMVGCVRQVKLSLPLADGRVFSAFSWRASECTRLLLVEIAIHVHQTQQAVEQGKLVPADWFQLTAA